MDGKFALYIRPYLSTQVFFLYLFFSFLILDLLVYNCNVCTTQMYIASTNEENWRKNRIYSLAKAITPCNQDTNTRIADLLI